MEKLRAKAVLVGSVCFLALLAYVAFVAVKKSTSKARVTGVARVDQESVALMKKLRPEQITQVRVFGPAFPKVERGEQGGVLRDRETIDLIWYGASNLMVVREPNLKPSKRRSGFEFTYRLPDGSGAVYEYRFEHLNTHLRVDSLRAFLGKLREREDLGLGETIDKMGP